MSNALKSVAKTAVSPKFWLDAALVMAGFKASDLAAGALARIPNVPQPVALFGGPAVVLLGCKLGARFVGAEKARMLAIGASVHAADSLLNLVGLDFIGPGGQ